MSDNDRGIYRAIYTSIWDDLDFRKLSPETKLVFLNLRTSPLSNMPVIFPYYLEAIQRQTGLSREAIERALGTLCDTHWVSLQEGIVWIRNGLKFDPTISLSNPNHRKSVINSLKSLPKIKIVKDFCDYYGIDLPYTIPIPNPIPDPIPIPYADQDKDKDKEKEKNKAAGKPVDNSAPKEASPRPSAALSQAQKETLATLCAELQSKRRDFNPYAFIGHCIKENIHPDAQILALRRFLENFPSVPQPWAYCCKIAGVESGNFNERDFQEKAGKDKNIFTELLNDLKKLHQRKP